MIGRRQLAVASPISATAIARAFKDSLRTSDRIPAQARALVARRFEAKGIALTDSGTSALVLALRTAVPPAGVVGFPGYACVDLAASALRAGVQVRLYDLDPTTLSPDLDSVRAMMRRGVDAIVVAHLFGYAADVRAVRSLAEREGVAVIEDAAQGAAGSLNGQRLGTLGDLAVVSFGRGKGLCAAGGGALLASDARWVAALEALQLSAPQRGWSGLSKAAIQWALGRPAIYAIPAMLPWLHLGEMVYHPAGEPVAMSLGSSALLASAFDQERGDLAGRRRRAAALDTLAANAPLLARVTELPLSESGYLRYAVRDLGGGRRPEPALGIVRPYGESLAEQVPLRPALVRSEPATPGASELSRRLFTLPVHRFVSASDLERLAGWIAVST